MSDHNEQPQTNTYVWSQSTDQITISFLVPESTSSRDLEINFEKQNLKAGIRGQEPVFEAKLFQPIDHFASLWQLEKTIYSPFSSVTGSPTLSIASSYAFMSPNHSPNASMILPPAHPGLTEVSELLAETAALGSSVSPPVSEADDFSHPNSPTLLHTPPSIPTPTHLKKITYRTITIHLEKEDDTIEWAVPVAGAHTKTNKMDMTSCFLLGQWFEKRMSNLVKALELYTSAAERGHTASMIKAAGLYEVTDVGNSRVPEKDSKKAFEWYKRAADCMEQNSGTSISNGPDALACYVVGTTYGSGSEEADVEKNYQSALYYYNRCMMLTAPRIDIDFSLLDQPHIPKSQLRNHAPHTHEEKYFCSSAFQTGLIYLYGSHPAGESTHSVTEVDADPDLAIRYWKEAALLGHAQACFNIAILYANGMGVTKDVWTAGKWFNRAIKLDTTGNLSVPEGVALIDWDAVKEVKKDIKKKKKKRSKKSTTAGKTGDDIIGAIIILGSMVTMATVGWYIYQRMKKNE
ncbi:hypothetical protein BDB01DRAFT_907464 [Pilobolus umbonatus]|nr:hypothetical protein BDB01DRAFT_907464 [Pilobolus umbonatus]